MDTELNGKLVDFLKEIEKGKEFLVDQAPSYVQEFLAWEAWSAGVGFVLCSVLLLLCAAAQYWALRRANECNDMVPPVFVISLVGGAAFLIGTCVNGYNFAKVKYAPRIVIVEHVSKQLHPSK